MCICKIIFSKNIFKYEFNSFETPFKFKYFDKTKNNVQLFANKSTKFTIR